MANEDPEVEEIEEDGNTSLELIDRYNQSDRIKRFCQPIVELFIFIFTIDPFAIYKAPTYRHRGAKRFRMYQTRALRIKLSHLDKWRWRWRIVVRLVVIYFCLKFSAIIVVQVALHASRSLNIDARSDWEVMLDRRGPLVEWAQLLGNPLIRLPGMTIFMYGLIVSLIAYTVFYLFHYYTIEPFNSVVLRLWLEPAREFRRINMSIMQRLHYFNWLVERTCHCAAGAPRRKYAAIGTIDYATLESRGVQTRVIGLFRSRYWHLRPINYTPKRYKWFNRFAIGLSMFVVAGIVVFIIGCLQPLIGFLFWNELTNELDWSRLSNYQTLTLLEVTICLVMLVPMCAFMVIFLACLCYAQLVILFDVRNHLLACLMSLRQMNGGEFTPVDHVESICILLRPLIKISLSLDELRTNAKFWSELVSINLVMSSTVCVCILLAGHLDGENLADFRLVIITFHWAWANFVLISAAYTYTSSRKLESITWSMMAELRIKETRDHWILFEYQVTESWRRLIMSRCFSDSRLSVRPFGIIFTFDRLLQLNFLAISFASLLWSI